MPSDTPVTPAIPDGSDRDIRLAHGKRIHGWTVVEWIAYFDRNPDATAPGGVAGAIVLHFQMMLQELE